MSDFEQKLARDLQQSKEYREAYAEAFSNEYLATQIRILRKQRNLTQSELGERIGSNQGRISVYEDDEYGKWSLDTLRKLASEFGLCLTVSFESYSSLIHAVTHFSPEALARSSFENDRQILQWLAVPSRPRELIVGWAGSDRPDRATLAGWLEGRGLSGFQPREMTPAQYILSAVPESDKATQGVLSRELAALLVADPDTILPLLKYPSIYRDNLYGLAAALGPRAELQDAIDAVYRIAEARGMSLEDGIRLSMAMIHNQADARWKDLWQRILAGGAHPADFENPQHSFLPGGSEMGIRGLLGLPQDADYWKQLAIGVREVEQRFYRYNHAGIDDEPNIMDELENVTAVIFDWWGEPRAARELVRGSIDLIRNGGSWSVTASAAWAREVDRQHWNVAVCEDVEYRSLAEVLAQGAMYYEMWRQGKKAAITGVLTGTHQYALSQLYPKAA